MTRLTVALFLTGVLFGADEKKKEEPAKPPVITAEEKLVVKEAENMIFRLRLDINTAKEKETKLVEEYTKILQPLYARCQTKSMILNEKLECVVQAAPNQAPPSPK